MAHGAGASMALTHSLGEWLGDSSERGSCLHLLLVCASPTSWARASRSLQAACCHRLSQHHGHWLLASPAAGPHSVPVWTFKGAQGGQHPQGQSVRLCDASPIGGYYRWVAPSVQARCVCVCLGTYMLQSKRSENNLWELILTFYHMGPGG